MSNSAEAKNKAELDFMAQLMRMVKLESYDMMLEMIRCKILLKAVLWCIGSKKHLSIKKPLFNPHAAVAQKIADQRWLIANSAKK